MTIERVRRWLVVIALAVLVLLGAVFGYARYRAHRFLTRLPKQLGIDVTSETNGFTWSQSVKGKTLFTIHAAKAIQRHDGKTTLHDVVIILYGRTVDEQHKERTDRIYGNEFEYDQPNGVIRAVGEVHIDLQAPGATDPHAAVAAARRAGSQDESQEHDVIHVRTSGLVFLQKLGVAATDEPLDFHANGVDGDARGADYDSDTGVLILRKDVKLRSTRPGSESATVFANRAELDRLQHKAVFNVAHFQSPERNLTADNVFLDLRDNGSPQHARAEGHVVMIGQDGSRVETPHAETNLSENNQPQFLKMIDGVRYTSETAASESRAVQVKFNKFGRAETADLSGSVRGNETSVVEKRSVSADHVNLHFSSVGKGPASLREIKATGAAQVTTTPLATPKGSGPASTVLSADTLVADLDGEGKLAHITHLTGEGHTAMEQTLADGGLRKSTSDHLDAHLSAPSKVLPANAGPKKPAKQEIPLESAVQTGNVVILDRQMPAPAKKPKSSSAATAATESHATAARAEFDGPTDRVVLTGSPRIDSGGTNIVADRIGLNRSTGDADATGNVKGSYASEPGRDPMHVLAASAEFHHAASSASFFGVNGGNARLWQGSSMVEAPVIDLDQKTQTLHAHTDHIDAKNTVHTSLLNQVSSGPPKASATVKPRPANGGVTRIVASDLLYRGDLPQPTAVFSGGARVQNGDGIIVSDVVTATMKPAADKTTPQAGAMMAGAVDHIVAEGAVHLQQTGRSGTGSRLTYDVAEGDYVLSGTPDAPPHVTDAQHGQVTGASLLFHAGDDSVVIVAAPGKRVRAETRVKR
ncbi:hypothetical protein [Terriglobus saanensis]|uniref:hypothetical protein n=1 Tax=Terriglobus saanensis TaxID=870903 RepID=UPI0016519FAF|nr:hypothetical protein [Terriglobus saanensis]